MVWSRPRTLAGISETLPRRAGEGRGFKPTTQGARKAARHRDVGLFGPRCRPQPGGRFTRVSSASLLELALAGRKKGDQETSPSLPASAAESCHLRRQKRLVSVQGRLTTNVKFWGGVLGHLNSGGTFSVSMQNVAPGDWELKSLDVDMQGKALLFKTIGVQQRETYSNYTPMPAD